jgi:hypothetical protein
VFRDTLAEEGDEDIDNEGDVGIRRSKVDGDEFEGYNLSMMRDEVEVDEMADKSLVSVGWRGSECQEDGPTCSLGGEPITSSTILLKSTWLLCFDIGSINPGGGHTSSLNIEPVSDVRVFIKLRVDVAWGLDTWVG